MTSIQLGQHHHWKEVTNAVLSKHFLYCLHCFAFLSLCQVIYCRLLSISFWKIAYVTSSLFVEVLIESEVFKMSSDTQLVQNHKCQCCYFNQNRCCCKYMELYHRSLLFGCLVFFILSLILLVFFILLMTVR